MKKDDLEALAAEWAAIDMHAIFRAVDPVKFRQHWLETAKDCSIGVLMFGFAPKAWDYPQTLRAVLKENPQIRRRLSRWVKSTRVSFSNILTGEEMAYMLRP